VVGSAVAGARRAQALAAAAGLLLFSSALGLLYWEWLGLLRGVAGGSVALCGGESPVVAVPSVEGLSVHVYCLGPWGSSPASMVNQSLYACPRGSGAAVVSVSAPMGWPSVSVRLPLCPGAGP